MTPRTILGYAKLYADEAANGGGLEAQIADIFSYCQRGKPPWPKPERIIAEVELSTAGTAALRDYLRSCQPDLVLVTTLNRFSREALELATTVDVMMALRIRLICIQEGIDTLEAEDWRRIQQFTRTLWHGRSEPTYKAPSGLFPVSTARDFYAFTRLPNGTRVPEPDTLPWLYLIPTPVNSLALRQRINPSRASKVRGGAVIFVSEFIRFGIIYRLHEQGVPLTAIASTLEESAAPLHAGQRWRHRVVQRILGLKYRRFYVSQLGAEFWRHPTKELPCCS
jgi:hypothetical protein